MESKVISRYMLVEVLSHKSVFSHILLTSLSEKKQLCFVLVN